MTMTDSRAHPAYDAAGADEVAARETRAGRDLVALAGSTSEDAQRRIAAIRADDRRSAAAKQQDEAEVRAQANALIHAFGRAHEAELVKDYDVTLTLLSTPSSGMTGTERVSADVSFRDALDRASQTAEDGRALGALYARARRTGDAILQRAAFVVALDRGEDDIVAAWVDERPADRDRVERLRLLSLEMTNPQRVVLRGFGFAGI